MGFCGRDIASIDRFLQEDLYMDSWGARGVMPPVGAGPIGENRKKKKSHEREVRGKTHETPTPRQYQMSNQLSI